MHERGWVQRILGGDRKAAEQLVARNYAPIYRLLRHLTGCADTAEDLTQQTFLRAWEGLEGFRGEARLSTWLHRIAYHEYTHWLRSRHEHASLDAAAEAPDRRAADGLTTVLVSDAMRRLGQEHREAFVLYYVQQLSVAEAAVVLGVPPGTVKSRLFAARERMRVLLRDAEAGAAPVGRGSKAEAVGCVGGGGPR